MRFDLPLTLCQILSSRLLLGGAGITHAQEGKDLSQGQAIFICGHSFHIFIQKPLEALAKEAGFTAHQTVGTSTIGGSQVMQHWELPGGKNPAKEALLTGQVDVLTLAPIAKNPTRESIALRISRLRTIQTFASWFKFPGRRNRSRLRPIGMRCLSCSART